MPTILDSVFHKVVNTTSSPIGWKMGVVGSGKVADSSNPKNFIWPNGINSGCFQFHISQNGAKATRSLTSQSCGDSLLNVYLAGQVGAV